MGVLRLQHNCAIVCLAVVRNPYGGGHRFYVSELHLGEGAQTGDISQGDIAARDIYKGANADSLVALIRYQIDKESQFRLLDVEVREVRQRHLDNELAAIRAELRHIRIIIIVGIVAMVLTIAIAI